MDRGPSQYLSNVVQNQVSSYVIFPKDNLKLTYAIGRDPRVMSKLEFDAWLGAMSPTPLTKLADLIMPRGWGGGFTAETEEHIDRGMGATTTWDVLLLEGGKRVTGDYRSGPSVSLSIRQFVFCPNKTK